MKNKIFIKNNDSSEPYTAAMRSYIKLAVNTALEYEQFPDPCEVSVTLTNDEQIHALNKKFRDIDAPTDVLSFPLLDGEYGEDDLVDGFLPLGDIIISTQTARRQAESIGHGVYEEIAFLCVHSTLHLLGYDHVTSTEDENEMFSRQKEIMQKVKEAK